MRIAISGPPGSGKTTVGEIVASRMGFELVLVGQLFRQMAVERKMDLAAFSSFAEEDETIDRELDDRMVAVAKSKDDIVIEGRLTGALLKRNGIEALAVHVDASEEVRSLRIAKREKKPVDVVLRNMRRRERSERKRYFAYYGIDPSNRTIYDLWIDSSSKSPEDVANAIIAEAERRYAD
ncbi:MAG: cytidylate kinase family protein [Methanobacteriota archaeon]|nr:MAG: cytidylate kinase family protein [Euryarchaeota archaeon]